MLPVEVSLSSQRSAIVCVRYRYKQCSQSYNLNIVPIHKWPRLGKKTIYGWKLFNSVKGNTHKCKLGCTMKYELIYVALLITDEFYFETADLF